MKKQESKKSTKWILLAACLVALLVIVGLVVSMCSGAGTTPGETTADPNSESSEPAESGESADLYWNVDRLLYAGQSEAGLSSRQKAEDGYYHVVFAFAGDQVDLKVPDAQMVNRIDGMELMGLNVDANGVVTEIYTVDEITGGVVADLLYIQELDGKHMTLNSAKDFKGMSQELELEDWTKIYDVSPTAEKVGMVNDPIRSDRIIAIQNRAGEVTHVYIVAHEVAGSVYWNVTRMWNSTTSETSRVPDENGEYVFLLAVDGEQVTLKTKLKSVANFIDSQAAKCVGLTIGSDGYITNAFGASRATGGSYFGSWHDVTAIEDGWVYIEKKVQAADTGSTGVCKMAAKCGVYDVSGVGDFVGVETELRVGDRIQGWTNSQNELCTIFVVTRPADSAMYWNITRKYDAATNSTSRTPNSEGYYEFQLAHDGGNSVFRTNDKELATKIDAIAGRTFGLKVDGDIILRVYSAGSIYMGSVFGDWHDVITVVKDRVEILKDPNSSASNAGDRRTGFMAPDCKVYDVSAGANVIGEETSLRVGDRIVGYMNIDGQIKIIWVISGRTVPGEIYWNLSRKYDDKTASTTRTPVNGWYLIDMAVNGKQVTLRTRDKSIATQVDKFAARCMGLKVSGTTIEKVYATSSMTGGGEKASWYDVMWVNGNTFFTERTIAPYLGRTLQLTMAQNCQVYNVSSNYINFAGEKTTLKVGDRVHVLTNKAGEAYIVYVVNRSMEADIVYNFSRQYNSTTGETTRTPDSEGWYRLLVAKDGEQVTVKTRDKNIASLADSYVTAIVGMVLNGDEIIRVVAPTAVAGCEGGYVGDWGDVMEMHGNDLRIVKNSVAFNTGTEWNVTMASDCKVYDVSGTAEMVGQKAAVQVGDRVEGLANKKGEITVLYIMTKNTHTCFDGTENFHYCEHCGKEVRWEPWGGSGVPTSNAEDHYYLTKDVYNVPQKTIGSEGKPRDFVLCLNGHTLSSSQRAFLVWHGSTLTILDHTSDKVEEQGAVSGMGLALDAKGAANHTGVIMLSNGTLNVYGGDIRLAEKHNPLTNAGVISVDAKSTVNLYGGAITGGDIAGKYGTPGGGAMHVSGGTLNIYDGATIRGGKAYNGGNLFVTAGATVNMYGGVITGGQAVGKYNAGTNGDGSTTWTGTGGVGGNIRIDAGCTFNFTGGVIEGGSTVRAPHPTNAGSSYGGNGGNIALYGTLNMSGDAVITGGYSGNCGGNIALYGTLKMNGGTIENSDAQSAGKGIFTVDTVTIDVNGGTIDGGIEQTRTSTTKPFPTIKLSGSAVLTGLIIPAGERLTVDKLTDGAKIRVSISDIFTDGTPEDPDDAYAKYFEVLNPLDGLQIVGVNGALTYGKSQCECAGTLEGVEGHTCKPEFWTAWSNSSSLPTTMGNYILTQDVTTGQNNLSAKATVKLDLNGKTVTAKPSNRVYAVTYAGTSQENMVTLVITDSSANRDGKLVAQGNHTQGGVLWVPNRADVRIYGGILDGSRVVSAQAEGGATIDLANGAGAVTMYGGTVFGGQSVLNSAGNGGHGAAVSVISGTFTMHGGQITGGMALNQGGAVYIAKAGTFTMNDGTIQGGSAKFGGSVAVQGTFNLNGGTVDGGQINAASGYGGNIAVSGSGKVNMAGGTVSGGTIAHSGAYPGGNVAVVGSGAYFNMSGGTVTGGKSYHNGTAYTTDGGNVLLSDGHFLMTGGTVENGEGLKGGNFRLWDTSELVIGGASADNHATVTGGIAQRQGGNIHADKKSTITVEGYGVVSNGIAKGDGLEAGNTNNGAGQSGGSNIYLSASVSGTNNYAPTLNIRDHGQILGSPESTDSSIYAGGKSAAAKVVINMEGGTITGGHSTRNQGANLRLDAYSEFNLKDGVVSDGLLESTLVDSNGGNIVIAANAVMNMSGGTVSGGTSRNVAGNVQLYGTLNMSGGLITGGKCYNASGAMIGLDNCNLFVVGATFHMSGGRIDGGVGVYSAASLKLSGAPVIDNESSLYDLQLNSGFTGLIDAKELTKDAKIGINVSGADRAFADVSDYAAKDCFFYNNRGNDKYAVTYENGQLFKRILDNATVLYDCACRGMAAGVEGHVCSDIPWQEWDSTTGLPKVTGNYILKDNVNSGQNQISAEAKINLDLNGKTVKANGRAYVPWGNNTTTIELAITDSKWNPEDPEHCGRMIGTSTAQGGVIWTYSKANICLFAGILDASAINSTFASGGAAAHITSGSTFTMYDGLILGGQVQSANANTDQNSSMAGAVYIGAGATFTLNGGTISGGRAKMGGNMAVAGTVIMNGGTVTGGTVNVEASAKPGAGGNVAVLSGGKFIMNGGTIEKGLTTTGHGGGNIVLWGGSFEMNGGTVTGGRTYAEGASATRGGGNFLLTGAKLTMRGDARVIGGVAGSGGNFALWDTNTVTVTGDAQILDGQANNGAGGNLYMNKGTTLTIGENAVVSGGTSSTGAANIHSKWGGGNQSLTISGNARISGGKGADGYGSVYLESANVPVKLAGTVTIADSEGANLVLGASNNALIDATELTDGARIGITLLGADATRVFATVGGSAAAVYFVSDAPDCTVACNSSNQLYLTN